MTTDTRSPEEIERAIERERAGLTSTLDQLQDKFSVETVARQVSDQFREHGGEFGRSVTDAVKRNPLALAVTGIGFAWLMMSDRSPGRDRYERDHYDADPRYGRTDRRDSFDRDKSERLALSDDDHDHGDQVGRTGLPNRAGSAGTQRSLGRQPGTPSHRPYAGRYAEPENTPSWVRAHENERGIGARLSGAVSGAASGVSGAASTAADKARDAAGAVSDAGKSLADSAQGVASSASDRAAALRERLAEGTESLSEEARNRVIAARENAIKARDAAMSYARDGRERATDLFEEQPLIAGALAVAVGAALGAALPRSRVEDDYLGQQSDHLMDEAERIFAEEKQRLVKVAEAATDEAKTVVSEVKGDAKDMAKSVVDKARDSGERIADAAQTEAKEQHKTGAKKS
ncbi:DUF3618 domain-containing protein [Rhodobacteraceae bacterium KMM 6894]|nr:DUF3618 domain-containing protein [Rhodobacteraceae bacterium KMM 6894]